MYKAVFIDIDGTLIRSDHSVSDFTIQTINKIRSNGVKVVLVSARPLHGIVAISKQIGLHDVPIASLNGSYTAIDNNILLNSFIPLEVLKDLHQRLSSYDLSIIYYDKMEWFAESENKYTVNEQKITEVPIIIDSFDLLLKRWEGSNSGPNKLLVVGEAEIVAEAQASLSKMFIDKLNMATSKPIYLEVMNMNASKKHAVEFFLNYYNLKREEVIAIGDNYNDIEMIRFAGLGIAMGNAPQDVKAAADYITNTNNEDGVANALNKYFNI